MHKHNPAIQWGRPPAKWPLTGVPQGWTDYHRALALFPELQHRYYEAARLRDDLDDTLHATGTPTRHAPPGIALGKRWTR